MSFDKLFTFFFTTNIRGLVRDFTGRVLNFSWQVIGGPFPQKTLHLISTFTLYLIKFIFEDGLPKKLLEHFLLFCNIAPLLGWVHGTHCQKSAGARAPVAPALTRALNIELDIRTLVWKFFCTKLDIHTRLLPFTSYLLEILYHFQKVTTLKSN